MGKLDGFGVGASVLGAALGVTELEEPGVGFTVTGLRVGDGVAITSASPTRRNKTMNFMFGILDSYYDLSGKGEKCVENGNEKLVRMSEKVKDVTNMDKGKVGGKVQGLRVRIRG